MLIFFTIVIIIGSALLVGIILIQNPKSAGTLNQSSLGSKFMSIKDSLDLIERSTWTLAAVVFGVPLLINIFFIDLSNISTPVSSDLQEAIQREDQSLRLPPSQLFQNQTQQPSGQENQSLETNDLQKNTLPPTLPKEEKPQNSSPSDEDKNNKNQP